MDPLAAGAGAKSTTDDSDSAADQSDDDIEELQAV